MSKTARQPRELALLKGAHKVNAARYAEEVPKSDLPFGEPPAHMPQDARDVWAEIESLAIPGVLTGADRLTFEIMCNTFAEYRRDPENFQTARITALLAMLSRFGMSPADRNRLAAPAKPKSKTFKPI